MEKPSSSSDNEKPKALSVEKPKALSVEVTRPRWRRGLVEINGILGPKYRRYLSYLLLHSSYDLISVFPHESVHEVYDFRRFFPTGLKGITGLRFNSEGKYLATVTRSGFLYVDEFNRLLAWSTKSQSDLEELSSFLHIYTDRCLNAVCWNPQNENEIACASSNGILIFDIGRSTKDYQPYNFMQTAISMKDLALSTDSKYIFACGSSLVKVWDRRMSGGPCQQLGITPLLGHVNSITSYVDNQVLFGAAERGRIYMWDLRGGQRAESSENRTGGWQQPMDTWNLSTMVQALPAVDSNLSTMFQADVESIDLDPCCPYQLGFHLDNGWSGVVNTFKSNVTHLHGPRRLPRYLEQLHLRKACWVTTASMYAVGSVAEAGIDILNFSPDTSSPLHVDRSLGGVSGAGARCVGVGEDVNVCAAHPLDGTIIGGSQHESLMFVSEKKTKKNDASPPEHVIRGSSLFHRVRKHSLRLDDSP